MSDDREPGQARPDPLELVLSASSDPDNPSAEGVRDLLRRVRRIAVIGMSRSPEKPSSRVPGYLAANDFHVVPVNPSAERIQGRRAYPTLADVPDPVDLVMIFRPSEQAGAFVREALMRPERPAIWLSEGIRADAEVGEARRLGVTVVQDLCAYKVHVAMRRAEAATPAERPATARRDPSG